MAITTPYLWAVKPGKYKTKSSKIIFEDYTHDPDQGVPLPKDDARNNAKRGPFAKLQIFLKCKKSRFR